MRKTAGERYRQLVDGREPYLRRARECAKLTIPALMPPDGYTSHSTLPTPFQSVGARGVNNLAAKLLLTLLPPNSPFFRLTIDDFALEKLAQREGMRGEVEKALSKIERAVMGNLEAKSTRVTLFEGLKHLINDGNTLLFVPPDDQGEDAYVRAFTLDQFVVKRAPNGAVLEIIVNEKVAPDTLPLEMLTLIPEGDRAPDKTLDLYTYVYREGRQFKVHQEIKGQVVPKSKGNYPLDKTPWLALRWTKIDGDDYGRSYVEEYIGDLRSLEALSKAIVEGSAAAAKILFLTNPNGVTDSQDLAEAENGDFVDGDVNDVGVLQLQKYGDFRVAKETVDKLEQRLSLAFLLNTAIQRNGERVTAEEIRYMAGELETALGGTYAILSQELQLPLARRIMAQMEAAGNLPTLPKGLVKPTVVTGVDALGRGNDLAKLDSLLAGTAQLFGPEAVAKRVDVGDYITRRGAALGLDTEGLVIPEDVVRQQEQAAMLQQLVEKLGPNAINAMGKAAEQGQAPAQT